MTGSAALAAPPSVGDAPGHGRRQAREFRGELPKRLAGLAAGAEADEGVRQAEQGLGRSRRPAVAAIRLVEGKGRILELPLAEQGFAQEDTGILVPRAGTAGNDLAGGGLGRTKIAPAERGLAIG
jgi:hypothetical protein